jgi:hypothetical protein
VCSSETGLASSRFSRSSLKYLTMIRRQRHAKKGEALKIYRAHGSLDIQCEVLIRHTVPLRIIDVHRRGRRKPQVSDSGPNTKSLSTAVRKSSILSGRSINFIGIKRRLFRFELLYMVILPLSHDVTGIPDQDTYLLAFGWNIELLIFRSIS